MQADICRARMNLKKAHANNSLSNCFSEDKLDSFMTFSQNKA